MYQSFYRLTGNPFGISPDPRYLYATPTTHEALACLEYGISSRKGFIVLTGEVGTGKTTLLRAALNCLRGQTIHTSFLFNPRLDMLDFLDFILTDFGLAPENRTKSGMLRMLNQWLIECYARKEVAILMIDEAQNLSLDMLEEIRLLTNLETSSEKLLQIVLSGQPELELTLRDASVRQLRQRIALWCRTRPFDYQDTSAYIAHRLFLAGTSKDIFSSDALHLIHHYSRGIPRIINLVCEHALIFGFVGREAVITEQIVLNVIRDLDRDIPSGKPIPADNWVASQEVISTTETRKGSHNEQNL